MALHNSLVSDDMHTLVRWTFADEATRLAQSVTAADIGKIARQEDSSPATYFLLDSVGPVVWLPLAAQASLQSKTLSGSVVTLTTHWRSHPQTTGFAAEVWNFSHGVNTADPTFARFNNAVYFKNPVTLETALVVNVAASATAVVEVELWQVPLADGDITNGTATQLAQGTWTWDQTNKVFVRELTIVDPNILAGSQVQFFVKCDEAVTSKFNFSLLYREV